MDEFPQDRTINFKANTKPLQSELSRVTLISDQFGRSLMRAFEGLTLRGKGLADVVRSLGQDLARMAFRNAFKPLEQGINSLVQNVSGTGAGSAGLASGLRSLGMPIPFAQGGVVASPTYFPLAGGRAGVMGERGAEAILPLSRGPDGRLGVAAQSGGGSVNVTFNVTSPDAESFRQSESQVSAMLARAVARGQRNL
ncbi:MAG: phage tail tape measure protein [Pseudomonadota bacterium]